LVVAVAFVLMLSACGASAEEQQLLDRRDALAEVGGFDVPEDRLYGVTSSSNPCGTVHTFSQRLFTRDEPDVSDHPIDHPLELAAPMAAHLANDAVELALYEYEFGGAVASRTIHWTTETSSNRMHFIVGTGIELRLVGHSEQEVQCAGTSLFEPNAEDHEVDEFSE